MTDPRGALVLLLASLLLGSVPVAAGAQVGPGEPPWACHVAAACDDGSCIALPGTFARLRVDPGPTPSTLLLDGRAVGRYASLAEANAALAAGALPGDAGLVLVEQVAPGDAIGFMAFAPSSRGGTLSLSDTAASLICVGD